MKKTLIITSQKAHRDPQGNLLENHIGHTFTVKDDEDKLRKILDKVLRGSRPVYLETDNKQTLVVTKALLENSVVYFVEDN